MRNKSIFFQYFLPLHNKASLNSMTWLYPAPADYNYQVGGYLKSLTLTSVNFHKECTLSERHQQDRKGVPIIPHKILRSNQT